jgi:hypothetical protein
LRTKPIAAARVKTDAVGARMLLRLHLLPGAYIASPEIRDLRKLLRQRIVLTQLRSALKCRVHALIARHGVLPPHGEMFGLRGLECSARARYARPRVGGSTRPCG